MFPIILPLEQQWLKSKLKLVEQSNFTSKVYTKTVFRCHTPSRQVEYIRIAA